MKRMIRAASYTDIAYLTDSNKLRDIVEKNIALYEQTGDRDAYWNIVYAIRNSNTPSDAISKAAKLTEMQASDFASNPNCSEPTLFRIAKGVAEGKYAHPSARYQYDILNHSNFSDRIAEELLKYLAKYKSISDIEYIISHYPSKLSSRTIRIAEKLITQGDKHADSESLDQPAIVDWDEVIPIDDKWFKWADTADERVVKEKLEDNGYAVFSTLGEAC